MADRELRVDVKTTGDPSGVNAVTAAINAQKAAADAASTGATQGAGAAKAAAAATAAASTAAGTAAAAAGTATVSAAAAGAAALQRQIAAAMEFEAILRRTASVPPPAFAGTASARQAREYADNWKQVNDRVRFAAPALRAATTETANLGEATRRAGGYTTSFGQAALQTSYLVDDMQYGIKGVVNNIPLLVASLGLGTGAAGIIGILAAALGIAAQKFDLFGGAAEKAVNKAREATNEARIAANDSKTAAEDAAASNASWKLHADAIEAAATKYKHLTEDIGKAQAARERLNRIILAETDAEAAADLADIEARRVEGNITDTEAEGQSSKVMIRVRKKRFEMEQAELAKREEELGQKAIGMEEQIKVKADEKESLADSTANLLTNEARKQAQNEADRILKSIAEERKKKETLPRTIRGLSFEERMNAYGPSADLNTPNRAIARASENIASYQAEYEPIRQKLEADREAQNNPAKVKDAAAAAEKIKAMEEDISELKRQLNDTKQNESLTQREREGGVRIYKATTRAENQQSGTRITTIQSKENQEREKDRVDAEKENEREAKEARAKQREETRIPGRAIADDVRDFAKSKGAVRAGGQSSEVIQRLTNKAEALRDGIDGGELKGLEDVLNELAQAVGVKVGSNRQALQAIWRTVNELKKQNQNAR